MEQWVPALGPKVTGDPIRAGVREGLGTRLGEDVETWMKE